MSFTWLRLENDCIGEGGVPLLRNKFSIIMDPSSLYVFQFLYIIPETLNTTNNTEEIIIIKWKRHNIHSKHSIRKHHVYHMRQHIEWQTPKTFYTKAPRVSHDETAYRITNSQNIIYESTTCITWWDSISNDKLSKHSIRKHHVYHMMGQHIEWQTPKTFYTKAPRVSHDETAYRMTNSNSISTATTKAFQSTGVQAAVVTGNYARIPAERNRGRHWDEETKHVQPAGHNITQ
jgi:hypothetical protein